MACVQQQYAGLEQRGVMLLGLLICLVLGSIGLMAMVDNLALQRQRQREQELLFVGEQYRLAIQRYYFAAPAGQQRQLPHSLQAMLDDERYVQPVHHLRRLYADPLTNGSDWGEVRIGDGLVGVYSKSEAQPIKQAGFAPAYASFSGREHYTEWVFAFVIPARASAAVPGAPTGTPVRSSPRKR